MLTSITLKQQFCVSAKKLYCAWSNSEEHAEMTGGEAECSDVVGGSFSVWDGYITGKNLSLVANSEIVQTWRSTEFKDSAANSKLVVTFKDNGCELTLSQTKIPDEQPDFEQGWEEHYFVPRRKYFGDS